MTQGRAFLQFMKEASDPASIFGQMLKIESDMIASYRDDYVLHEHLEQHNAPCYFKDFMAQADEYQLAYLGEANFIEMLPQHVSPEVQRTLEQASGGNIILTEQSWIFCATAISARPCWFAASGKAIFNATFGLNN